MRTKVTTYTETINPIYPEQGNERKVTDMSVAELRSVIREIVREEIAMQHFTSPMPMPMPIQPWYHHPETPIPPNQVWCDTKENTITGTAYDIKTNEIGENNGQ